MSYTAAPTIRQLDYREASGLQIELCWERTDNRLFVQVYDERNPSKSFTVDVDPSDALDAFHHPHAYLEEERNR